MSVVGAGVSRVGEEGLPAGAVHHPQEHHGLGARPGHAQQRRAVGPAREIHAGEWDNDFCMSPPQERP